MAAVLTIETRQKKECIDITDQVRAAVKRSGVAEGLCHAMVLHTTAALTINENADPGIRTDLVRAFDGLVKEHDGWLHDAVDNNTQSHILASILGCSQTIPIQKGALVLGRWQGLMLVELDGPRQRQVAVTILQGGR